MPKRIQRKRTKGWRMPEGAVYVGRPTRWGNPIPWRGSWITWAAVAAGFRADAEGRRDAAVALFRYWLTGVPAQGPLTDQSGGGVVEYEDGTIRSVRGAARGFASFAANVIYADEVDIPKPPAIDEIVAELRGKDLACWCPLDQPCHADVLLKLANESTEGTK